MHAVQHRTATGVLILIQQSVASGDIAMPGQEIPGLLLHPLPAPLGGKLARVISPLFLVRVSFVIPFVSCSCTTNFSG